MKLAFYKAEYGTWFDKAIAWWTKSKYSHVELILGGDLKNNASISASSRLGRVRIANINYSKYDPMHWDIVNVPDKLVLPSAELQRRIDKTVGAGYDWTGIFLTQLFAFNIDSKSKYYCSELVAYLLGLEKTNVDPQELFVISTNL